jgi:hypothetical protein
VPMVMYFTCLDTRVSHSGTGRSESSPAPRTGRE